MIRPTSLFRSDSASVPQFRTPVVSIRKDTIDCGISVLPCCLPFCCHKYATPRVFLFALALLGICQGSIQAYFATTLGTVREIFGYSYTLTEWLSVSHDLFLGLTGLIVTHFGYKIHRTAWIGGLACIQGAACFLVMIPYLEHLKLSDPNGSHTTTGPTLCKEEIVIQDVVNNDGSNAWITLAVLFTLQFCIGIANASFFAHGFSYLDDNLEKHNSPVYLAILIAIRSSTVQFGGYMAWSFLSYEKSWWIGYPIIGSMLILTGTLVATFPRYLMGIVMQQTAANIVEMNRSSSNQTLEEIPESAMPIPRPKPKPKQKFFMTLKRVISNKLLIINTLSSVFMYMAVDNFASFEGKYMEAQYYIPTVGEGFGDQWTSRLLRNILKSPLIALSILISGLIIGKFQPKTTRLACWNVICSLIVASIFVSYVFIDCEKGLINGAYKNKLTNPYCSKACNCEANISKFEPVCTQAGSQTFYSPCHAGCNQITYIGNHRFYSNCTCSTISGAVVPTLLATDGACGNEQCALHWNLFQALTVLSAALLASGFVGNILITLRAVIPSDKSMAIALELCAAGILVHVPGKIIYTKIADASCQYFSSDGQSCRLHNAQFGDIISLLTATLLILSVIMDCLVVYLVRDIDLFGGDDYDNQADMPMQVIPSIRPRSQQQPVEQSVVQRNNNMPTSDPSGFQRPTSDQSSYQPRTSVSSVEPPSSTRSSIELPKIEQRRPPRPRRAPSQTSSEEQQPLTSDHENSRKSILSPRGRDGLPLENQGAQRNMIEELRQLRSTKN